MIKQLFLLAFLSALLMGSDTLVDYVKSAQKHLQMDRRQLLINQQGSFAIEARKRERFAHFSGDLQYADTKADLLPNRYSTTDLSLTDTIDLFDKSGIAIERIRLQTMQNRMLLNSQKEHLFLSLIDMIAAYEKIYKLLALHQHLYREQMKILKQLEEASRTGAVPKIESDRFANALALFEVQIAQEKTDLETMQAQLKLYVPDREIPVLNDEELKTDMADFLAHRPDLKAKEFESRLADNDARAIRKKWLPDASVEVAYQQNSDPTANGNNHSLLAGLHFDLNANLSKDAEAARVRALQSRCEAIGLKTAAKTQFLQYLGTIRSAEKRVEILKVAEKRAKSTLESIKTAYLKRYTDFNSYLQTLQALLSIREKIIDVSIIKQKNIDILNILGSGAIYEVSLKIPSHDIP